MSLTVEDIKKIAQLARLSLTSDEEVRYAEQLSAVLSYVDMLSEVDTDDVGETTAVTGLMDVIREDNPSLLLEEKRAQLLAQFPQTDQRMLSVPAVFEDQ